MKKVLSGIGILLIIIASVCVTISSLYDDSRLISDMFQQIDESNYVTIIIDGVEGEKIFLEKSIYPYVMYGGEIIHVEKPWNDVPSEIEDKYDEASIKFAYYNDDILMGTSEILAESDRTKDYVFKMDGVYVNKHQSMESLTKWIKEATSN